MTLRKSRAEPNLFELCRDAATSRRYKTHAVRRGAVINNRTLINYLYPIKRANGT